MDERLLLEGIQNRVEGIFDRQHEAGSQLLQRSSGIHERGRVGEKLQPRHRFIESPCRLREAGRGRIALFGEGDVGCDAPEELRGRLRHPPLVILGEVPPAKDDLCLRRQSGKRNGRRRR